MSSRQPAIVNESQLVGYFQRLQAELLKPECEDRLGKPLSFWTLLSDRRLPHAFLDRTIRDLLETPFSDLCETPGIGQLKMMSLITLLTRATQDAAPAPSANEWDQDGSDLGPAVVPLPQLGAFDPAVVSELLWTQWGETIKHYGIEDQPFGRLAPNLIHLPAAIWQTPLKEYLGRTVNEIRHLKTHGEKRVNAILEVFFTVHTALTGKESQEDHLALIAPEFIAPVEAWIQEVYSNDLKPSRGEVLESLTVPLLKQLRLDAGESIYLLASERLGEETAPMSVRNQSKARGVTRARIYQLLEECGRVMAVRWPEGETPLHAMLSQLQSALTNPEAAHLISATTDLFFPVSQQTEMPKVETHRASVTSPLLVQ